MVVPVASRKSIPPTSVALMGTSPTKMVLEDTFKSWKKPLLKGNSSVPKDKVPLMVGMIFPDIEPPATLNLSACKSPVACLRSDIRSVLVLIWSWSRIPVVIKFPLKISLRESNEFPVAINSPLNVLMLKSNWFPLDIKTPLKTPISSVRAFPVTIRFALKFATSFVNERISPSVARMSVLTPRSGICPLTLVTGAAPATVVMPSIRESTMVVVVPLITTSTTVWGWLSLSGRYLRVNKKASS